MAGKYNDSLVKEQINKVEINQKKIKMKKKKKAQMRRFVPPNCEQVSSDQLLLIHTDTLARAHMCVGVCVSVCMHVSASVRDLDSVHMQGRRGM